MVLSSSNQFPTQAESNQKHALGKKKQGQEQNTTNIYYYIT